MTTHNGRINASDIGVAETVEHLASLLDTTRGGTFAVLHQYSNEGSKKLLPEGKPEIADYGIQFGIGYERIKERSVALLVALLAYAKGEEDATFPVGITCDNPDDVEVALSGPGGFDYRHGANNGKRYECGDTWTESVNYQSDKVFFTVYIRPLRETGASSYQVVALPAPT